MFQLRIPTRPYVEPPARLVRYAIVAAHTFREALEDVSLDDKINALADKVAELQERLESLDDSHIPKELEAIDERSIEQPESEPKAKAKQSAGKQTSAKHGRTATRKPSAKTKK